MPSLPHLIRRAVVAATAGAMALTTTAASAQQPPPDQSAQLVPFQLVEGKPLDVRFDQPEDRYALASGCYTVEVVGAGHLDADGSFGAVAAATPLHFQATDLGTYLLARNDGPDTGFEGAWWDLRSYFDAGGSFVGQPSASTEWTVVASGADPEAAAKGNKGQEYVLTSGSTAFSPVRFHHVADDDRSDDDANGTACANWPEVATNTIGVPEPTGNGPGDEVQGLFETHVHGMAFEFLGGEARCGRPWHRYGVEFALVDCEDHQPDGRTAVLEHAVSGTDPLTGHDPVGWPTFGYWPKHNSLTHEQVYWKWLERSWLGGLRMYVNLLVENQVLCEIYPIKRNSCNEMDSARLQAQRMFAFQDYIDAQWGGPGEGWYRIVTTPAQARRAINAGRMAVIMGIEISTLFDCGEFLDVPLCTTDDIDARLAEVFDMGVRQMELLNKFDSALSGVKGDGGTTGLLVNSANRRITGHWWDMQPCAEDEGHPVHAHDNTQMNVGNDVPDDFAPIRDPLAGAIEQLFGPTSGLVAPAYGPAPHCNTRGFTELGRYVVQQMAARGMFIDPDHMSALGQAELLTFVQDELIPAEEAAAAAEGRAPVRPAILSSHSWANDVSYRKIYELGGFIGAYAGSAANFANDWAARRSWFDELAPASATFGLGYGADTNGLGGQPGPRSNPAVPLSYDQPWEAPVGGVLLQQQVSGLKAFDINVHGVAHYGLFADWFREVQLAADEQHARLGGGDALLADMLKAPEVYLQTWERAVYGGNECVTDQSMPQVEDLHALLGMNFEQFQESVGRPADREGAAYVYCVQGANGEVEVLDVVFGADGTAQLVQSSASGVQPTTAPAASTPGASDGHTQDPQAAGEGLPATGGGLPALGLLVGFVGVAADRLRRRRP